MSAKALLKLVKEWQDDHDFAEDITVVAMIDYRVHSRLLGKKAGIVSKVMKQFNVVISRKNVEDAKDYLADLAQDLMVDVYSGLQ